MDNLKIYSRCAIYIFFLLCAAVYTVKEQLLFTPAILLLCAVVVLGRGIDEAENLKK